MPSRTNHTPLPAGRTVETHIPLMPSGTTFLAGETPRLVVQSWSVPGAFEGGETRQWDTITTGRCRLHSGARHPSHLLIPS
ncbi:CocE/NonD family hydrolase C-terminal non-catalytic domain-containing protein [Streptomyces sp. NPDC019937]|uniref:CocE/NonD family hydrolase C-terminal non-catalytic domain-containing protein n=1 Tax=Streptomyces sp. NPDC019937 TaxID=3154787 RepID=UPI0033F97913